MIDWALAGRPPRRAGVPDAPAPGARRPSRSAIGFAISFALALVVRPPPRGLRPDHRPHGHPVHDPEPGAVRRARADHRASRIVTAEVPLVLYTLLIFVRNIVAGFDSVPARRPRGRRRHGLPARRSGCWRVELPLAIPLDRRRPPPRERLDDRARDDHGDPRRPVRRSRLLHPRGLPPQLPDRDPRRRRPVDPPRDRRRPAARPRPARLTPWTRRRAPCRGSRGRRPPGRAAT